jgi:hypothetical protein
MYDFKVRFGIAWPIKNAPYSNTGALSVAKAS